MKKYWKVAVVAFIAAAAGSGTVLAVGTYLVDGVSEPRYDLLSNGASYRASISHDSGNVLGFERRSTNGSTYYGDVASFDLDAPVGSLSLESDGSLEVENSVYAKLRLRSTAFSDWGIVSCGGLGFVSTYGGTNRTVLLLSNMAPTGSLTVDSQGDTISDGNVECDDLISYENMVFGGSGTSPATDAFLTASGNGDVIVQLGN